MAAKALDRGRADPLPITCASICRKRGSGAIPAAQTPPPAMPHRVARSSPAVWPAIVVQSLLRGFDLARPLAARLHVQSQVHLTWSFPHHADAGVEARTMRRPDGGLVPKCVRAREIGSLTEAPVDPYRHSTVTLLLSSSAAPASAPAGRGQTASPWPYEE